MDLQKKYLEIYRQRYETFRHLDKLFWQMLQVVAVVVSAALIFGIKWWSITIVGIILIILGIAMAKIDYGKRKNNSVLSWIGNKIGDKKIPNQKPKFRSASFWVARSIVVLGALCLLYVCCHYC